MYVASRQSAALAEDPEGVGIFGDSVEDIDFDLMQDRWGVRVAAYLELRGLQAEQGVDALDDLEGPVHGHEVGLAASAITDGLAVRRRVEALQPLVLEAAQLIGRGLEGRLERGLDGLVRSRGALVADLFGNLFQGGPGDFQFQRLSLLVRGQQATG